MYYVLANFCAALFATCIVVPVGIYYKARNRDIPKDQVKAWVKDLIDRDCYQVFLVLLACFFWPLFLLLVFGVVVNLYLERFWIYAIHYFYPEPPPKKSQEDTYR